MNKTRYVSPFKLGVDCFSTIFETKINHSPAKNLKQIGCVLAQFQKSDSSNNSFCLPFPKFNYSLKFFYCSRKEKL